MIVKYSENNSGGGRWLTDKEVQSLKDNGWNVEQRHFNLVNAEKEFSSIKEALEEFESITDQCVTDEGCNCCGAPHRFEWDNNYESGVGLLDYLEVEDKDEIINRLKR